MNNENQQAVTEIARESPEAAGLVFGLISASMDANNRLIDSLLEAERVQRMAREVQISEFLVTADAAFGGTVREYEKAINLLRYGTGETDEQVAARHWGHDLY